MLKYTLKRLLMAIPVVWGIVTIVFVLMRVFSANPAYLMLGQRATAERVAELTAYLGLDKPILTQYGIFLKQLFQGDFQRFVRRRNGCFFAAEQREFFLPGRIKTLQIQIKLRPICPATGGKLQCFHFA